MQARVSFGSCSVDQATRQVFRDGVEVHLPPKAFDLLTHLIAQRPRVLAKAELHRLLWPSSFVTDDSLARLVSLLRAAIGDTGRDGSIVRTVHGVGYAFAAEVAQVSLVTTPAGRSFRLVGQDSELVIGDGEHIIGRDPGAHLRIDSPKVSRRHARVFVRGGELWIEDLDSKNGTFVNGHRITGAQHIAPESEIRVGPFVLRVCEDAALSATETGTLEVSDLKHE